MALEEKVTPSVCAGCGASFVCGAVAGLATCWCMEKPAVYFAAEAGGSCYCPACLDKRVSEQLSRAT
ncbi:cysteine-rich CWC family protein [Propionivibrio sp.]|uniref:cysteine-rich CWC family protein n=1 Tax=Propionivibrio sp. TaxID=2212460 RepID=UPI003BF033B7